MLLVQCRWGTAQLTDQEQSDPRKNQKETIPPPAITPITNEMIERARAGKADISVDWDFLAKKLEALKDQNEVDTNEKNLNESGRSALHYAALLGASDIVQALLDRGCDPNIKTEDENDFYQDKLTPLHLAVEYGNDKIVKSLLDKGAKVNEKDGTRKTPLDIALDLDPLPKEIIRLLVSKLSKDEINEQDGYGETFLYRVLNKQKEEATKVLLDCSTDIDVNIPDVNKITPLHLAVEYGYADIVKILLDKHASLDMKNYSNETPLELAENKIHKNQEIIDLLKARASKK
jgi:ankyrin repeat protein